MISLASMRRFPPVVPLVLVGVVSTVASAQPSGRKQSGGTELQLQAIEDFVEAVIYDRAGQLEKAARSYEDANRSSPHANTYFNLADVYRRMERLDRAVENYKKYLELAPRAPDRAAVAKLVETLEQSPGRVVLDGHDLDGVIFLDGKLLGPSPQRVTIADKELHRVDRITPTGHEDRTFTVTPMRDAHITLTPHKETPGNVVFAASPGLGGGRIEIANEVKIDVPGRMTVKPGRYRFSFPASCKPVEIVVPGGKEVTFVYFAGKRQPAATCVDVTVTQTRVRFP